MLKLKDYKEKDIQSSEMKDGQIAIITKWSMHEHYIGIIVMRVGNDLYIIGKPRTSSWGDWFVRDAAKQESCRVRLLSKGDVIEITENQ